MSARDNAKPEQRVLHRRLTLRLALAGLALCSCATSYRLESPSGAAVVEASGAGIRLQADGNAWPRRSGSLKGYVIPIRVEVTNDSDGPVLIRFSDFELVDQQGYARAAIPPAPSSGRPNARGGPLWRGEAWLVPMGGAWVPRPRAVAARRGPYRHFAPYGYWPRPSGRNFWYWPAYGRAAGVYVSDPPSGWEMARLGLAEGRLHARGEASGFVYFPGETGEAKQLELAWRVHDEAGELKGVVRVPFVVRGGD